MSDELAKEKRDAGVSVPFFCGAMKLLAKSHGNRMSGNLLDEIRHHLAMAEMFYENLPPEVKVKKARKRTALDEETKG